MLNQGRCFKKGHAHVNQSYSSWGRTGMGGCKCEWDTLPLHMPMLCVEQSEQNCVYTFRNLGHCLAFVFGRLYFRRRRSQNQSPLVTNKLHIAHLNLATF